MKNSCYWTWSRKDIESNKDKIIIYTENIELAKEIMLKNTRRLLYYSDRKDYLKNKYYAVEFITDRNSKEHKFLFKTLKLNSRHEILT
jgi:hypothetical protein